MFLFGELTEVKSALQQTGQRISAHDGQLPTDQRTMTTAGAGADRRRLTKGRSRHSDNRCVSVDSIIAAAASKVSQSVAACLMTSVGRRGKNVDSST